MLLQTISAGHCKALILQYTYEQRVREIERASFTPLVFSALGGMSKPAETTYKRLASLLATVERSARNKSPCRDFSYKQINLQRDQLQTNHPVERSARN